MSRKHVSPRFQCVINGDMSADITSTITDVEQCDHCRYVGVYTGAGLSGEFKIYVSDDKILWSELTLGTTPALATGGDFALIINQIDFKYIKLVYDYTAGTGTLNAYIKSASIGA